MANKRFLMGMLIMALLLGMALVGCASGPEIVPTGADPELNGTWKSTVDDMIFNNGGFENTYEGSPLAKGTYTASDGNIRIVITQYYGGNPQWKGLLQSRWYTRDQIKETFGDSASEKQLNDMFKTTTGKYSVSGNVLTVTMKGARTSRYLKAGAQAASSQSGKYMIVNTDALNVRSGPSADFAVVGQLTRNTRVEILERPSQWFKIKSGNVEGYVNSSMLAEEK